jgi:hypothetical protein
MHFIFLASLLMSKIDEALAREEALRKTAISAEPDGENKVSRKDARPSTHLSPTKVCRITAEHRRQVTGEGNKDIQVGLAGCDLFLPPRLPLSPPSLP